MRLLTLLATLLATLVLGSGTGSAAAIYPWCVITDAHAGGTWVCGFVSEAQCRSSRTSNVETCNINPRYQAHQLYHPHQVAQPRKVKRQRLY